MAHPFRRVQRAGRIARIHALPFDQRRLAAAANTGKTRIRQRQARALRRFEYGFARLDGERFAAGLQSGEMRHGAIFGNSRDCRRSRHVDGPSLIAHGGSARLRAQQRNGERGNGTVHVRCLF